MSCVPVTPFEFAEYVAIVLAAIFILAIPLLRYLDGPRREYAKKIYPEE